MNLSEATAREQQENIQRYKQEKKLRKQARRQKWSQRLDIGRISAAILLIVIGMICLLNNLGITAISFKYAINLLWPALLVIIGLTLVLGYRSMVAMVGGLLLMVAGTLFLIHNSGLWTIDFRFAWNLLWPLIIIFLGASLLFRDKEPALAPGFEPPARDAGPVIPPMAPPPMPGNGPVIEAEFECAAPAQPMEASTGAPATEAPAAGSGPSLDKPESGPASGESPQE